MLRRLVPAALAILSCLLALAGADGAAHLALLAAVPAAAVAVLDAVSERVARQAGIADLALAVGGLVFVLAGAVIRAPLIALGAIATVIPALAVPEGEPRAASTSPPGELEWAK